MKKLLLYNFIWMCMISCGKKTKVDCFDIHPYNGEYWQFEGKPFNGKCEGVDYNEKHPYVAASFKDGKEHGRYRSYYKEHGQIKIDCSYKGGKLHGKFKEYYQDDQLANIGRYRSGKRHGTWKSYYEDGQLKSIENYKLGQLLKEVHYDEDGQPL